MIKFKPIHEIEKNIYESYLFAETGRGCELSYANLCLWGNIQAAIVENHLVLLSQYKDKYFYPFPLGTGDVTPVLEAIFSDVSREIATNPDKDLQMIKAKEIINENQH